MAIDRGPVGAMVDDAAGSDRGQVGESALFLDVFDSRGDGGPGAWRIVRPYSELKTARRRYSRSAPESWC